MNETGKDAGQIPREVWGGVGVRAMRQTSRRIDLRLVQRSNGWTVTKGGNPRGGRPKQPPDPAKAVLSQPQAVGWGTGHTQGLWHPSGHPHGLEGNIATFSRVPPPFQMFTGDRQGPQGHGVLLAGTGMEGAVSPVWDNPSEGQSGSCTPGAFLLLPHSLLVNQC